MNSQVELHLLHSCLGACKVNHLLRTIPPDSILPQFQLFDDNLCHSLSCICNASIQLSLLLYPILLVFCLHEASHVSPTAFLGCCIWSQNLCTQLVASFSDSNISFPSIPGVEYHLLSSLSGGPLPPVDHPSKAQSVFQHSVDLHHFSSLLDSCSLQDQARLRAISHHSCASAWLRAIPSEPLGLTLSCDCALVLAWHPPVSWFSKMFLWSKLCLMAMVTTSLGVVMAP